MKKIALILLTFLLSNTSYSQVWEMNLNYINRGESPNIGTSSNDPILFHTNSQHWMTLTTGGVLNLSGLAGSGSRFLQVNASGDIVPWEASMMLQSSILYGDGTWRPNLIKVDGSNIYTQSGIKFGIGVPNPINALDVSGNVKVSENMGVAKSISIGDATQYGIIHYIPATSGHPAIMSFGGGYNNNWTIYPPPPDPNEALLMNYADIVCGTGPPVTSNSSPAPIANFHNDLAIDRPINNVAYGILRMGHNGTKAFLEVQGSTNPSSSVAAPLLINSCEKRNIYAFGGDNFESSLTSVMSVNGKMNITNHLQVGAKSAALFTDKESKLYVAIESGDYFNGIKVRQDHDNYHPYQGTDYHAIKVVDSQNDGNYAFGVYRTTDNSDGVERFNIMADGSTYINTTNADALVISDANNGGQINFKVSTDGKTEIKTTNSDAFTIKDASNNINFKVKNSGFVYAREVIVTLNTFPDYVFSKGYKLPALKEVKTFIEKNHRLPNMPSAKEVEKNGASLGEIQKITVEKVEELYLYILQLEEKIEALNKKIENK
jgi:hypothetical protein